MPGRSVTTNLMEFTSTHVTQNEGTAQVDAPIWKLSLIEIITEYCCLRCGWKAIFRIEFCVSNLNLPAILSGVPPRIPSRVPSKISCRDYIGSSSRDYIRSSLCNFIWNSSRNIIRSSSRDFIRSCRITSGADLLSIITDLWHRQNESSHCH